MTASPEQHSVQPHLFIDRVALLPRVLPKDGTLGAHHVLSFPYTVRTYRVYTLRP